MYLSIYMENKCFASFFLRLVFATGRHPSYLTTARVRNFTSCRNGKEGPKVAVTTSIALVPHQLHIERGNFTLFSTSHRPLRQKAFARAAFPLKSICKRSQLQPKHATCPVVSRKSRHNTIQLSLLTHFFDGNIPTTKGKLPPLYATAIRQQTKD